VHVFREADGQIWVGGGALTCVSGYGGTVAVGRAWFRGIPLLAGQPFSAGGLHSVDLRQESAELLRTEAAGYAAVALANIRHEFPAAMQHTMTAPGDFPYRPRARTPVFYRQRRLALLGPDALDLLRLLRTVPGEVPGTGIRSALGAQFSPVALAAEAEFVRSADARAERPQGWGWALALVHETQSWDTPDAPQVVRGHGPAGRGPDFRVPRLACRAQSYPVRYGTEQGSAFGLSLAWPFAEARARAGDPALRDAIASRALAWFQRGQHVPGRLGAVGGRLCLTGPDRGGADGPRAPAARVRRLGGHVPARPRMGPPVHLVHPGGGRRSGEGNGEGEALGSRLHGLNATGRGAGGRLRPPLPPGDPRAEPAVGGRPAARQGGAAVRCRRRLPAGALAGRLRGAHAELRHGPRPGSKISRAGRGSAGPAGISRAGRGISRAGGPARAHASGW